jgi:hypothetical protein
MVGATATPVLPCGAGLVAMLGGSSIGGTPQVNEANPRATAIEAAIAAAPNHLGLCRRK